MFNFKKKVELAVEQSLNAIGEEKKRLEVEAEKQRARANMPKYKLEPVSDGKYRILSWTFSSVDAALGRPECYKYVYAHAWDETFTEAAALKWIAAVGRPGKFYDEETHTFKEQ